MDQEDFERSSSPSPLLPSHPSSCLVSSRKIRPFRSRLIDLSRLLRSAAIFVEQSSSWSSLSLPLNRGRRVIEGHDRRFLLAVVVVVATPPSPGT